MLIPLLCESTCVPVGSGLLLPAAAMAPSIYTYIHVLTVKVPLRCQHAQFLITTSFIVWRKLEILSSLAQIVPNKPVEKENQHIFSSLHETVLWKRCLIRTYELCDLN